MFKDYMNHVIGGRYKLMRDCIEFEWDLNPNVSVAHSFLVHMFKKIWNNFLLSELFKSMTAKLEDSTVCLPPHNLFPKIHFNIISFMVFVVAIGYYPEQVYQLIPSQM
jgi:hypothetical protein